jgi:hypothetical protein
LGTQCDGLLYKPVKVRFVQLADCLQQFFYR